MFKKLLAFVYKSFAPQNPTGFSVDDTSVADIVNSITSDLNALDSPLYNNSAETYAGTNEVKIYEGQDSSSPFIEEERSLESPLLKEEYPPSQTGCSVNILRCYSVTKAGNQPEECEDAYANASDDTAHYFAVSDGATESSFSREWAKELVNDFVQRSLSSRAIVNADKINDWLLPLQRNWANWLATQNLVWFAKRKAEQGTFATLIGLMIQRDRQWQAFAVGDSCLFVVRNGTLQHSFPLSKSSELGYRPYLIATLRQTELPSVARYMSDTAQLGDRFYIVTDALAGWILSSLEDRKNPWVQLDQIQSQDAFFDWVETLRDRREMVNDDTTMLLITVSSDN